MNIQFFINLFYFNNQRKMKKLNCFLSFFLLLLIGGVGSVQAQNWQSDKVVTTIVPGQNVCRVPQSATDRFLAGGQGVSTLTDDAVYTFEEAGTDGEGNSLYRLKQNTTGKYLKHQSLAGDQDSSDNPPAGAVGGAWVAYTDNAESAFTFTALHPEEGGSALQKTEQTYETPAEYFILTSEYTHEGYHTYLGFYSGKPFLSPWTDTNLWQVYSVKQSSGIEYLASMYSLFPEGVSIESYQNTSGTGIGCYSAAAYDEMLNEWKACEALMEKGSALTLAEATAGLERLKAAKTAWENSFIPVTPGYYVVLNFRGGNGGTGIYDGKNDLLWQTYTMPEAITSADAKYIWKVEAGETAGTFKFQNFQTKQYITSRAANSKVQMGATGADYAVNHQKTAHAGGSSEVKTDMNPGVFSLEAGNTKLNTYSGGFVGSWNDVTDYNNLFQFFAVSDDVIKALEGDVIQTGLNSELESVYEEASTAYNKSRVYTNADATPDELYDDMGLIADYDTQVTSNATDPEEGSIGALGDGDKESYFHSNWHEPYVQEYHYLQVDLGESMKSFTAKYTQRNTQPNNGNPCIVQILSADKSEGPWVNEGFYTFTYPYETTFADEKYNRKATGICGVEMAAAHRYVRFVVRKTFADPSNANMYKAGYPLFYLSEFHIYSGATYDPSTSVFEQIDKAVGTALQTQLAAAAAELTAGKATEATIAALRSAYEAFNAQYPDPSRLSAAISAAQTLKNNAPQGSAIGMYSAEAIAAFEAAIQTAQDALSDQMTLEAINSAIAALDAATAVFKSSVNLPETGGLYRIVSLTGEGATRQGAILGTQGNSETAALAFTQLKKLVGSDSEETVPIENLEEVEGDARYIWKVEEAKDGQITLRNLATGYYLGNQESLNGIISNVKEKTYHYIQGVADVENGINIQVGEGLYANYQGDGANLVAWSGASGADNSCFMLEPAEPSGTLNWPVAANGYTILTMPFEVMNAFEDGVAYGLIGEKEGEKNNTLELKEMDEVIPAGTPFIFKSEGAANITIIPSASNLAEMEYVTEAVPVAGLFGTLPGMTITKNDVGTFYNGSFMMIGAQHEAAHYVRGLRSNSGYFDGSQNKTTETGVASIALPEGAKLTAVGGAALIDANETVDVYTLTGIRIRQNVKAGKAAEGLPAGIYVVGGKKMIVK